MIFSIITVTYNASLWLERTIQSILSQSYPRIEYIVVDGNSQDETVAIIQKYIAHISRWISESDKGVYDAMNKGLKLATGDYVWFINAGDSIYSEDTLQKIANTLLHMDYLPDILYGETLLVNNQGDPLGMRRLKVPKQLYWQSFRMGMVVCHQSFLVKRTIAEIYDLQYTFTSDYDWCIRCAKKATSIHHTHLILSRFLEGGISSIYRKKALQERYQIMCLFYGKIPTQILHFWFAIRFYMSKWLKNPFKLHL